jgi:hypothetical protein
MSHIQIVTDSGDEHTVTLLSLSRHLADSRSYLDVLGSLITNKTAAVTLTSGESATVHLLTAADGYHPLSEQPDLPLREFQADAQLCFSLPGRVRCRAASDTEARQLITDVIRRARPAPPGFTVAVDTDDIDAFAQSLEQALGDSRNRTLGVRDVVLTNLTERRGSSERLLLGSTAS